jgi:hypothetical protein
MFVILTSIKYNACVVIIFIDKIKFSKILCDYKCIALHKLLSYWKMRYVTESLSNIILN